MNRVSTWCTKVKVVFGLLCFLVSIASIFRWKVKRAEKAIGFSQKLQNVAKAEMCLLIQLLHLKMESIETKEIKSENHFQFSISKLPTKNRYAFQ
jgi:preprotein translocase subunit Sec63